MFVPIKHSLFSFYLKSVTLKHLFCNIWCRHVHSVVVFVPWILFMYVVIENVCYNVLCIFSSGIENNPTVFYRLMPGSTAQTNKFHTFYLQQRADNGFTWADIKVNHPLDYESIKEYNLTIRVEVSFNRLYLRYGTY